MAKKKQVFLVKIDTTGMTPKQAIKFVNQTRKPFLKNLSKKELKRVEFYFLPTFEGDISDMKYVGEY